VFRGSVRDKSPPQTDPWELWKAGRHEHPSHRPEPPANRETSPSSTADFGTAWCPLCCPSLGSLVIDLHSHFWPVTLLRSLEQGRSWYGWRAVSFPDGGGGIALGDRLVGFSPPEVDLDDLPTRLRRRHDSEGVIAEAVQPVGFLWGDHLRGGELAAYCSEVNRELIERQSEAPDRLRGIGLLPFHAPEWFDRVLDEGVDGGLRAFACPTNVLGRNLDEQDLQQALGRIDDRGCAIFVHPTYLTPVGAERMQRYYFHNTLGAPLESAVAVLSLVQGGFFERRPEARVIVANGGGCAALEIGRLDRRHQTRADCRTIERPPSESLARCHFDSLVLHEESLRLLIARVGPERVMIGTDHPFRSDTEEGAFRWIAQMDWLDASTRDALLHGNARRFLGVELAPTDAPHHGDDR